jgi:Holliday junction resolvasome RuvABC endonuclease subunit
MSGGVLGLDLAASYGWAYVDHTGAYVASGHRQVAADSSLGRRAYYLKQSICDLITEYAPDWIAIEAPIHAGKITHFRTARSLYVYAGAAEEVSYLRELGFIEFPRSTCCKAVLGFGNAKKEDGVKFARSLKPSLQSDDEADAILVALTGHKRRIARAA